jgi:hypothetical protein
MRSGCTHGEFEQERTGVREQRNTCTGSSDGVYLSKGFTADTGGQQFQKWSQVGNAKNTAEERTGVDDRIKRPGNIGLASDTGCTGWKKHNPSGEPNKPRYTSRVCIEERGNWENFPTQSPVRKRDDGVSNKLVKFVVNEFYQTISYTSQENRIENVPEVWERVSKAEIWEQIRGLYSLESPEILLKTMQLYSTGSQPQRDLSPFCEEVSRHFMPTLQKYGSFRSSPQGQELEKQRAMQFDDSLSFLPHEVALAARRFETALAKFESWHRNESIKAYGNAVVPQVVFQIFKAIENIT